MTDQERADEEAFRQLADEFKVKPRLVEAIRRHVPLGRRYSWCVAAIEEALGREAQSNEV